MTRLSAPSPAPIAVGMSSDAAGDAAPCVAPAVAPVVAPGADAPPVGAEPVPGPHAAAMSPATAIIPPSLLWNMAPPLELDSGVTPGRGACAVASRQAARIDPVRRAPPWTMYAGSAR